MITEESREYINEILEWNKIEEKIKEWKLIPKNKVKPKLHKFLGLTKKELEYHRLNPKLLRIRS